MVKKFSRAGRVQADGAPRSARLDNEYLIQLDDDWCVLMATQHQQPFGVTPAKSYVGQAWEVRLIGVRGCTLEQIRRALPNEL